MNDEKAIVPLNLEPPERPEQEQSEMVAVQARTISKFAEASMIEYTPQEQAILLAPIEPKDIKIRPDGQVYLEWAWYADRLDAAIGAGQWSLSPAPWNPRLFREGNITYREYVLWIRGQFAGNAVGHHEEQRKTANFGDAAEATYANALVRCCKRIGMARDLWKKDKIDEFKQLMKNKGGAAGSKVSSNQSDTPTVSSPPPLDGALLEKANKACNAFHCDFQIGQGQLESFLKRDKVKWNAADIDVLTGVYKKLRKGAKPEEFFAAEVE